MVILRRLFRSPLTSTIVRSARIAAATAFTSATTIAAAATIAAAITIAASSLLAIPPSESPARSLPAHSSRRITILSAQVSGGSLLYSQGDVIDKAQSNDYVTVIRRSNAGLQVFYHDPNAGNKLVKKDVPPGNVIQITYWDGQGQLTTKAIEAWTPAVAKSPTYSTPTLPSSNAGEQALQSKPAAAFSSPGDCKDNYCMSLNGSNGSSRWKKSQMPLKVYLSSDVTVPGYQSNFDDAVKQAFDDWTAVSDGKISFQYVSSKDSADITVSWTADASKFSDKDTAGHAAVQRSNDGAIEHSDILMLTSKTKDHRLRPGEKAHAIALHEIGHSLGIFEHSPNPSDTMHYTFYSDIHGPVLTSRDINTIKILYANRTDTLALKNPRAFIFCALEDRRDGKFSDAAEACERALKLDPNLTDAKKLLADTLWESAQDLVSKRDYTRAESAAKRCAELRRETCQRNDVLLARALHLHAFVLFKLNRNVEAERIEQEEARLPI